MRSTKSIINSGANVISFIIAFIPNLIIRKFFLETLGSEMLGINSLYTNIIGWLSIVEMGIGSTIVYSLYKPFSQNNKSKISAYIKFYGKFYKRIGFFILVLGICLLPFLQNFIIDNVDIKVVRIGFFLALLNSFISYLFSHRLCILNVSQEGYKITLGTTISKIIIAILQILMFKSYPNFILFILIQLCINFIYFILINLYVKKQYIWIDEYKDEIELEEKKGLSQNIRAMFMHKIGSLVVGSTDNIVISKFVGLTVLANYVNYQTVIGAFQSIVCMIMNGMTASIGNMLVNESKEKAYEVHKKIFFLNFWIVSFIIISLYNTLEQFICIWVGKTYLLDKYTFVVILINIYFSLMRSSVEQFQSGSGFFYKDRYVPIIEALVNIIVSIVLAKKIGILGVFIGTLSSNFLIVFWTKPYIIYKYIFNRSVKAYFVMYFKYLLVGLIPLIITNSITQGLKTNYTIISFVVNCIINIVIINSIYIILLNRTNEFKYYTSLLRRIFKRDRVLENKKFSKSS